MKFSDNTEISFLQTEDIATQMWHKIMRLRSEVFVLEQACVYLDPDPTDLESIHVVVKQDDVLVAYSRIYRPDSWHLGRIIVAKSHRNTGLGKWMMAQVIQWFSNQDVDLIEMSAQVYLSDFYQQFGFKVRGNMYLEDGIPHIRMELGKVGE